MSNIERLNETSSLQIENADKEGTYENKNTGDLGSKTVFMGNPGTKKVLVQKKVKTKKTDTVVFSD